MTETKLPRNPDGKAKGYGYITFEKEDSAILAFSELDNKIVLVIKS